jgi:hypothetical protein
MKYNAIVNPVIIGGKTYIPVTKSEDHKVNRQKRRINKKKKWRGKK